MTDAVVPERLLVQIASYNTNLQALRGLPQDLVDWLAPTLHVSSFLSKHRAPDIVAVGFQELLPLHQGRESSLKSFVLSRRLLACIVAGSSGSVIEDRNKLILSQIEKYAPHKESYSLIAKIVHVGIALLIYGRDDGVARFVADVETSWTGCGPAYMGNKGAVGVRFRLKEPGRGAGETYTYVFQDFIPQNLSLEQSPQLCELSFDCPPTQTQRAYCRLSSYRLHSIVFFWV